MRQSFQNGALRERIVTLLHMAGNLETSAVPAPTFWVRGLPVYGELVLAPLAGFTDRIYRGICRAQGAAMVFTELISADGLLYANERTWEMLAFDAAERPLGIQLFGREATAIVEAAQRVEALGPDVIDLNLGCSVPKVAKKGAGAAMLADPAALGRLMAALTRTLSVPVTAKIRLGPEREVRNYLEVARALEDNGAALITVHGRTRGQRYDEPADWDAIAEVKQAVRIPVLGNGDVRVVADVARMRAHTGCDGVMVGRAALGHPWFFAYRDRCEVPWEERRALMLAHLEQMTAQLGPRDGVIQFRKHAVKYLRGSTIPKAVYPLLLETVEPEEFRALLESVAPTR